MYRELPLLDLDDSDEGTTTEVDARALDLALLDVAAETVTAWVRPLVPRLTASAEGGPTAPARQRPEWAARLDER